MAAPGTSGTLWMGFSPLITFLGFLSLQHSEHGLTFSVLAHDLKYLVPGYELPQRGHQPPPRVAPRSRPF
jgi:hypothetical protein